MTDIAVAEDLSPGEETALVVLAVMLTVLLSFVIVDQVKAGRRFRQMDRRRKPAPHRLNPPICNRTLYEVRKLRDSYGTRTDEVRTRTDDPDAADLVGSRRRDGLHEPVLDLDIPHSYVPSSTPGHAHLYLDVPLSWRGYRRLLRALYRTGVIEKAYYKLALKRKETFVRPPWVGKTANPLEGAEKEKEEDLTEKFIELLRQWQRERQR